MDLVRAIHLEAAQRAGKDREKTHRSSFRYFKTNPETFRLAVLIYIGFRLSLRNVEDLRYELRVDVMHQTVRFWWHSFVPTFAAETWTRRFKGKR